MQNGHYRHTQKAKDSRNIPQEMPCSLPTFNKVAYFFIEATYPSLSGLFRSQSNVIPKDLTLAFLKGKSVNSYWGHVPSMSFRTQSSQET